MPLIPEKDQEQLRKLFADRLESPVRLDFYTREASTPDAPSNECLSCDETHQLLEELVALSEKLELNVHDVSIPEQTAPETGIEELPVIVLSGKNKGTLRFIGAPAGYEASTLIEDLVNVSRGTTGLQFHSREVLAGLTAPVHIKVFVTPTCPYCPKAAGLAHMMAVESEMVTADVIEVSEFPHLSERYQVYGVPKTVINETAQFEGARPEAAVIGAVEAAAAGTI